MSDPTAPPPPPRPGAIEVETVARGFDSAAGKRSLKRRAILVGAGLVGIQVLLPLGFLVAIAVAAVQAAGAPSIDVSRGAFWQGSLWLVERTPRGPGLGRGGDGAARVLRWSPAEGGDPQYAKLPAVEDPSLLAAGDALWVIGRDRCVVMTRDRLDAVAVSPRLERHVSYPFELDGWPAVAAVVVSGERPALFALDRTGAWTPDARVDLGVQEGGAADGVAMIVADAGRLRVFTVDDDGIAHLPTADGFTDLPRDRWEPLPAREGKVSAWTVGRVGGGIAAFTARLDGLSLSVDVTRLGPAGAWTPPVELDIPDLVDLGVFGAGGGGRYWLVAKTADGAATAYEVAGTEVIRSTEIAAGAMAPVMRLNAISTWATLISMAATPFLLLLALGGAMRRQRVWTYEFEGKHAQLASLPQRWAAGAIDLILATAPVAAAYAVFLTSFSQIAQIGAGDALRFMKWLGASSLWSLVALFVIAFVEGRTGRTPGNWVCGIRTVGVDLGRPGFGRSLLRNFLVIIDAAFGFALAILLIALTANQQRLGDLAARTVVVVSPRNRG